MLSEVHVSPKKCWMSQGATDWIVMLSEVQIHESNVGILSQEQPTGQSCF